MRARGALVGLALVAGALAPPGWAVAAEEVACPDDVPRAGFQDVAADYTHARAIDCVVDWEIARGASPTEFAPAAPVTRGQLASFVARTLRRSGGELATSPADRFADDDASAHHYSINRLAEAGVVQGAAGRFSADTRVSRAQLASLLVRTYEHRTGQRLPDAPDAFADDDASVHEDSIDRAAAAGLTRGAGPRSFAPDAPVSRGQLASFLARTLQAVVATGQVEQTPTTLRKASALQSFDACDPLLGHLRERAVEQVGPYGWGGDFSAGPVPVGQPAPAMPGSDEDSGGDAGGGGPSYSGTNNQEGDVDEADVVKTDGRTLWSLVDGQLRAVDVTGAEPRLVGALDVPFGYGAELLVAGTRALVLSSSWSSGPEPGPGSDSTAPGHGSPRTSVTWVDLTDPAAMRVEGVLDVDGSPVAARLASGVARLVVRTGLPSLPFTTPRDGSAEAAAEAAQHNRRTVETSSIADWLPRYRLEDRRSEPAVLTETSLYGCTSLHRPPEHSGLGTINVLTLDPALPPHAGQTTGVLADGDLVYASSQGLYVATTRWDVWTGAPTPDPRITTELHAFSLADRARAAYRASGKVDGMLLNQFAMSEHEGHLRVATTSQPAWWGGPDAAPSESSVVVLAEQGGALTTVGQVGGLGLGEVIRAVRFLGDTAYVVTFRQTDPLYTVDLSDPAAPRVVGELKIPGYSAYLHPLGDDLLLGVGQDADEQGQTRGAQLSLFDVSDPAAPRRLHTHALGEGSGSDVEFDHRAFLHWPATGLTVLPLSQWEVDEVTGKEDYFVGAVGVEVDAVDGFRTVGEVSHGSPEHSGDGSGDPRWPGIRRSVVVDDAVYTLSERGVKASDLTTFAERSWLPFPQR